MDNQRIFRLRNLLATVNLKGRYERNFQALYELLLYEFKLEGGLDGDDEYWNNLGQTIERQAQTYIEATHGRQGKSAPAEFRNFVSHFKKVLVEALGPYRFVNVS
ncbi:hypothetical protein GZH53_09170 [Flavihumibacter sp. R14]|nr:hypothetical protein [Flavihumibacter soli]